MIGVKVPSHFLRDNRTEMIRVPVIKKQIFSYAQKAKVIENFCVRDIKTGSIPRLSDVMD